MLTEDMQTTSTSRCSSQNKTPTQPYTTTTTSASHHTVRHPHPIPTASFHTNPTPDIFVGIFVATIFGAAFFFDLFWPERHESLSVKLAWKALLHSRLSRRARIHVHRGRQKRIRYGNQCGGDAEAVGGVWGEPNGVSA
jgi:hypothetical protein